MYNSNQKIAFINDYTKNERTARNIAEVFSWLEPYEQEWGMDLSRQSVDKLEPVVNSMGSIRARSTETILIFLKAYVKWCELKGFEVSKGIFDVKVDTVEKIRSRMVSSPSHLKSKLDIHLDPASKENTDIIYRVFLWMAFAGLQVNDAVRVTTKCVDLLNLRINFDGHSYEIYDESVEDFVAACSLQSFQYDHANYSTRKYRADGDIIMRSFRSPTVTLSSVRSALNKKMLVDKDGNPVGDKEDNLSYKRVYLSGVFYRTRQREQAGIPVDFSDYAAFLIEQREKVKEYAVCGTYNLKSISNKFERECLIDYEMWKNAFPL